MKARYALLALAAAFLVAVSPTVAADESDVLVLDTENFKNTIKSEKLILVEFYAPWCGHCKNLAPEYEKAATELKAKGVPIAKVDCTVEESVCKDNGVNGYPTLKVFRDGTPSDYSGARKADSIVGFMTKQLLPALSEVTIKNAESFIDSDKVVVVGFFKSTDSKQYKTLLAVANKLRDTFVFGATVDPEVVAKYEVKTPAVILFKKYDEGKVVFSGKITEEAITTFVETASVPLLAELGPENYNKYISTGLPLAYLFSTGEEDLTNYGPVMETVAKDYKGKINFVHIDANRFGSHGKQLGLDSFPGVVIQVSETNQKYVYDPTTKITVEGLAAFVQEFHEGKATPHFKSQPIPADEYDESVRVIVGNSFSEIVLDKEKDVFVEFYAPWCGHCKKLAPIWEDLASSYKPHRDRVVIAKMDGTENDVPVESGFKGVQGFPTLVLFKAKDNAIVEYEGDRSIESLIEFIEKNAVNKTGVKPDEDEEEEAEAGGKGARDEL